MRMSLYYATSVVGRIGHKEASCSESSVSTTTHAHIMSSPCLEEASKPDANHSPSPWKIVHTRRPRVRGVAKSHFLNINLPHLKFLHRVPLKSTSNLLMHSKFSNLT